MEGQFGPSFFQGAGGGILGIHNGGLPGDDEQIVNYCQTGRGFADGLNILRHGFDTGQDNTQSLQTGPNRRLEIMV